MHARFFFFFNNLGDFAIVMVISAMQEMHISWMKIVPDFDMSSACETFLIVWDVITYHVAKEAKTKFFRPSSILFGILAQPSG